MTPELKRSIEQLAQLQGVIEKLERERDEAQAKCAEMREALEFCKRCGFDTVDKIIEHALGGDRGKGYVREDDIAAKVKAEFPNVQPSAGHDWIDELIGLLRVAYGQRDLAEAQLRKIQKLVSELEATIQWLRFLVPKFSPLSQENKLTLQQIARLKKLVKEAK